VNAAGVEAQSITRASKSNLALAFVALSRERRDDITVFYAWCRVIDDIADDPGQPAAERQAALDLWKRALLAPVADEPSLAAPVRAVIAKYGLGPTHFLEIIAGVEMDLKGASFATWEELRLYCYRVASAVGLVSIAIFGCRESAARTYAESLGLALQLTNILRDVGEDWRNGGRVYLPREDLERFGYSLADLGAGRRTPAFFELMHFEAARARGFYAEALAARPEADRRALVAAEIMRRVYTGILTRMERGGFDVFTRRYRVGRLAKLAIVASEIARSKFS
jgi:phytoene synthase